MDLEPIDAELVEDEPGTSLVVSDAPDGVRLDVHVLPPGTICIPLDWKSRMLIRQSLAHYFDKGPRSRNTKAILMVLELFADYEPLAQQCSTCHNTGRIKTMYGMEFCHCPHGVSKRDA